jgi:type IV secretion system protein VirB10
MQTAVPIAAGNRTVVPPGAYINGVIETAKRPGRIKGRAQLQIHFSSITFPSGYSEAFPATVGSAPANENAKVSPEGRIEENEQKGRDAGAIIGTTGTGAVIGTAVDGARGAGIGAGVGAAAGLATILLTRGDEVRLNVGDPIEMVLDRPLTLTHTESDSRGFDYVPRPARTSRNDEPRPGYPLGYPGPVYPPVIYTPTWPR